jgi:hypothetical protein
MYAESLRMLMYETQVVNNKLGVNRGAFSDKISARLLSSACMLLFVTISWYG